MSNTKILVTALLTYIVVCVAGGAAYYYYTYMMPPPIEAQAGEVPPPPPGPPPGPPPEEKPEETQKAELARAKAEAAAKAAEEAKAKALAKQEARKNAAVRERNMVTSSRLPAAVSPLLVRETASTPSMSTLWRSIVFMSMAAPMHNSTASCGSSSSTRRPKSRCFGAAIASI